jgi:hypothetical protein
MLKLVSSVGLALAAANLKRRVRALAVRGILGAVGAVVLVVSVCFFLVAAYLFLADLLDPIASAAIVGGVLLVVALLLFFLASRPVRAQARAAENPAAELGETLRQGASRLGDAFGPGQAPFKNPVFLMAGFALLAGFLLGRRAKPRDED